MCKNAHDMFFSEKSELQNSVYSVNSHLHKENTYIGAGVWRMHGCLE